MKLGFLTAPLPEMSLSEIIVWANKEGFNCIEVACWPKSFEQRRYAGTQHIDVDKLDESELKEIKKILNENNIKISSLAYYPNPLSSDLSERNFSISHLKKVISAANLLEVEVVGTFVGRDENKNIEESLKDYEYIFKDIIKFAEEKKVKIAIENCPMLWADRWPGGNNLATTPVIWEKMFQIIKSENIGINFDPSHFVWQHLDYIKVLYEFRDKIFHIHAKDTRIDYEKLSRNGIYGFGNYVDKLAGLGDIDWKKFLSTLYEIGYKGCVSIEHEDRAWEGHKDVILSGIKLSKQLIGPYFVK
ncbi:MAG: sugar phosphate isomerase/epimerase family protein [Fusobacteriaceae bacterium]